MRSRTKGFLLACCLLTFVGCATSPIGVRRMDARDVHRSMTASALTNEKPSLDSRNVLYRHGLFLAYARKPVATLAELHRIAVGQDDSDTYFALAELSFLYGEKKKDRRYAIMSAAYAWSFLFGGEAPDPFDPRLRVAADIYNRGLTEGLERVKDRGPEIAGGRFALPIGTLDVEFDPAQLEWNGRRLRDFQPVAELEVRGLNHRFRTPGIGAPLAASAAATNVDSSDEFLAPRLKTPVTALLRFDDDLRTQLAEGQLSARLELHSGFGLETVEIADRMVPLEKEPTASLAAMVAEQPIIRQEIEIFLGRLTQRVGEGALVALRPHRRGRIPVVFVHGTGSSPARWAEMLNVLDNDPRINSIYEPWFFAYNSSSPIIYSSYLLRRALSRAVNELDPDGTDRLLREMVVIGHSQGGLLTKMTTVSSGDRFWRNLSKKPIEEIDVSDDGRALLQQAMFVEPLPFVDRVVFICTPHRGSFLAASGWVRRLIARVVTLPVTVTTLTASLVTLNPELGTVASIRNVNAVDNMDPGNRFIRTLSQIPVSPDVKAHSIVAVETTGPIEEGNDGVVEYSSAHIEGVLSEKVVHSNHSTQAFPDTIEEVRRILLLHTAETGAGATGPPVQQGALTSASKSSTPGPRSRP